ncbi:two-component system, OmpR family, sensor histidine kinase SenX3 [Microlunatus soli]|uniref:Sensor-like histidine kinase SenX3 n=2 Tax=Microlunatus soli TaxID=630515 RepID=A0A1H1S1K4_9ACTN|nr:two-component system, OmpR family, sensor histidine kinase SenX3 [Microlunatus soli]
MGLVVGALVVWLVMRRPAPEEPEDFLDATVEVPGGVSQLLAVLGSSAVVVGPHDEVLESTSQARTIGIVRGSRMAIAELLELVRTVRQDKVIRSVDLELKRGGTGSAVIFLSVRIAPLDDDLIVVLAEDRTTAVRVEETRRDFVANVSHELKTPIGAVALLAEAVEGAADDPEAVHRFAARLSIESSRLSDLVRQIIDLSRLQADDPLVQAEVVEVEDVLTQAVDRCRVDAEKRQVQLTIAGERDCAVLGSLWQLVGAVGNLVENAIIYSDPGARVAVAAHRVKRGEDEQIEITVSDNGIGIGQADLDRIFERFYRVDYARSRANGGTGLGLSIVKHIAAAHGGEVSVWSQLGQGSTFTISLPAPSQTDLLSGAGQSTMVGELPAGASADHPDGTESSAAVVSNRQRHRGVAEPVGSRTGRTRTTEPQEIVR